MSKENDALIVLRKVEWGSHRQGPGSGYMDSGGDGAWVKACPSCGGICPGDRNARLFIASVIGHAKNCELHAVLKGQSQ